MTSEHSSGALPTEPAAARLAQGLEHDERLDGLVEGLAPVARAVVGNDTRASVLRGAPHPNAGKLLVDFLISPEAQRIARDLEYIPVDPDIPPRDPSLKPDGKTFKAIYITPEKLGAEMPRWAKIHADLFR